MLLRWVKIMKNGIKAEIIQPINDSLAPSGEPKNTAMGNATEAMIELKLT